MKKLLTVFICSVYLIFPNPLRAQTSIDSSLKETIRTYVENNGSNLEEAKYRYVEIDLNGDNKKDALVLFQGIYWCGTGGCTMAVFQGTERGFRFISRIPLVREPVVVSDNFTKGWRDIIVRVSGGGIEGKDVFLKFNGSVYPSNPSLEQPISSGNTIDGIEVFSEPSYARDIAIQFAQGSFCGCYGGRVKVGDSFVLNLAKEQQLIVKKTTPHDYSVIAPNGEYLEVIRRFPNEENQYWTGNQSGNFKVKVESVPAQMQINIQFCAYSGEGE